MLPQKKERRYIGQWAMLRWRISKRLARTESRVILPESGKYFYPTAEQAQSFVDSGWATRVTSATFPKSVIAASERLNLPGEGPAYFVPSQFFPFGPVVFSGGG